MEWYVEQGSVLESRNGTGVYITPLVDSKNLTNDDNFANYSFTLSEIKSGYAFSQMSSHVSALPCQFHEANESIARPESIKDPVGGYSLSVTTFPDVFCMI